MHLGNIVFDEEGKVKLIDWTFYCETYEGTGLETDYQLGCDYYTPQIDMNIPGYNKSKY